MAFKGQGTIVPSWERQEIWLWCRPQRLERGSQVPLTRVWLEYLMGISVALSSEHPSLLSVTDHECPMGSSSMGHGQRPEQKFQWFNWFRKGQVTQLRPLRLCLRLLVKLGRSSSIRLLSWWAIAGAVEGLSKDGLSLRRNPIQGKAELRNGLRFFWQWHWVRCTTLPQI